MSGRDIFLDCFSPRSICSYAFHFCLQKPDLFFEFQAQSPSKRPQLSSAVCIGQIPIVKDMDCFSDPFKLVSSFPSSWKERKRLCGISLAALS